MKGKKFERDPGGGKGASGVFFPPSYFCGGNILYEKRKNLVAEISILLSPFRLTFNNKRKKERPCVSRRNTQQGFL